MLAIAAFISGAAIIDPGAIGPEASLLQGLAAALDVERVDIVLGHVRSYGPGERPRLAALSGYQPGNHDWGSFSKQSWQVAFDDARGGVIIAVETVPEHLAQQKAECDAGAAAEGDVCQFVESWITSDPDKRIFIAFTAADFDAAEAVRKALESQGYFVFVFLKGKQEAPWASPALVGEVFQSAGHRLVVDTVAARGSPGVAFESLCCEALLMTPPPPTKWSKRVAGAGGN